MEVKGKLVEIFETIQVSASFKKREFVLEYAENPQYPEVIKFEMIQDKCDLLDAYQVGQEVNVAFNLKGRKWVDPKGESIVRALICRAYLPKQFDYLKQEYKFHYNSDFSSIQT